MNALVGQKAKAFVARIGPLFRFVSNEGADDGVRMDGGDFMSAGAGAHLRRIR